MKRGNYSNLHPKQDMITLRAQVKNQLAPITLKLSRIEERVKSIELSDLLSQQIKELHDTLILDGLDVTKPVPGGQQTVKIYAAIKAQLDKFNELYKPIDEAITMLEKGLDISLLACASEACVDLVPDIVASVGADRTISLPCKKISAFQQACDNALHKLESGDMTGVLDGILQASHKTYVGLMSGNGTIYDMDGHC